MPGRVIYVGVIFIVIGFSLQLWYQQADLGSFDNVVEVGIRALQFTGFGAVFLGIGWLLTASRPKKR
jgi:hypothetical protein